MNVYLYKTVFDISKKIQISCLTFLYACEWFLIGTRAIADYYIMLDC